MQGRTPPPVGPTADDSRAVETEVETVTTRQREGAAPVEGTSPPAAVSSERGGSYLATLPERVTAVGLALLTALEGLLAMRFLLRAFGANTSSGFVGFIDDVSWPFMRPFANVFSDRSWDQGIVEVSTLVAMGVYFLGFALLGMLVTALVPRLSGNPRGPA